MTRLHSVHDEGGLTLIELLVTVTLLTIIGGALLTSLISGYRTVTFAENRIQAVTDLQTAMEYVGRNVRVADSSENAAIRPSTGTNLDLDVYRDDAGTLVRVRYTYAVEASVAFPGRSRLRETRSVWNNPDDAAAGYGAPSSRLLVDGLDISAPLFSYLDGAGNPVDAVANVQDVREVAVVVNRDTRDPSNPGRTIQVETRIALRNAE